MVEIHGHHIDVGEVSGTTFIVFFQSEDGYIDHVQGSVSLPFWCFIRDFVFITICAFCVSVYICACCFFNARVCLLVCVDVI